MATNKKANGDGTLRERSNGTWEFRAIVGTGYDEKPIRKSFYGKTQTEAKNKFKKFLKDNPPPLERICMLSEWALEWLELYKRGRVTDGTYYEYDVIVRKTIIPTIGNVKLEQLRPAHIQKLMSSVKEKSVSRQKKVAFLIKAIMESALENHFCSENVAAKAKPAKADKKEVVIFSREEIRQILASDHAFTHVVKLMLLTGLRRGELLALSWRNVDYENGVLHICQALSDGTIKSRTKGKKDRVVPIGDELKELLESIPKRGITVVANENGTHLSASQYNHQYRKFLKDIGVRFLSGHKCRASFATYLLRSGADIRAVQELLGHADLTMTQKYLNASIDALKDNVSKLKF